MTVTFFNIKFDVRIHDKTELRGDVETVTGYEVTHVWPESSQNIDDESLWPMMEQCFRPEHLACFMRAVDSAVQSELVESVSEEYESNEFDTLK